MIEAIVDANAVLRFLTHDIPEQSDKFKARLKQIQDKKLKLYLYPITIVEIVFHLQKTYKLSRETASTILIKFIKESGVLTQNSKLVIQSLKMFPSTRIDFVDIYLAYLAVDEKKQVLSFDRDFDKLGKSVRLEP